MANIKRGFRRVAWVLVALILPVAGLISYELSTAPSGYAVRLVTSDFPDPDGSSRQAIQVDGLGILYFPSHVSESEMLDHMPKLIAQAAELELPERLSMTEERRQQLDRIVQQMIANDESEQSIQLVVNDFKQKYGTVPGDWFEQNAPQDPTADGKINLPPGFVLDEPFSISWPQSSGQRMSIDGFASRVKAKYPEYDDLDAVTLTKRILTRYPVYRDVVNFREYSVSVVYGKRPFWAAGITILVTAATALLLHGTVSVIAWIAHGFKSS